MKKIFLKGAEEGIKEFINLMTRISIRSSFLLRGLEEGNLGCC
jgi:hypothetical protein